MEKKEMKTIINNKSITDGNKLIGKFMDKIFKDPSNYMYDNSWDWLMGVVEKIESLGYPVKVMGDMFNDGFRHYCDIYSNEGGAFLYGHHKRDKLKAVYETVIQFIQWYNKEEQKVQDSDTTEAKIE